jgi:hypothetical protein
MTAIGGLGHALPYLIPDFWTATITAMVVVFIELWAIALGAEQIHGHAIPQGGAASSVGRSAGVRIWDPHRERMSATQTTKFTKIAKTTKTL